MKDEEKIFTIEPPKLWAESQIELKQEKAYLEAEKEYKQAVMSKYIMRQESLTEAKKKAIEDMEEEGIDTDLLSEESVFNDKLSF